MSAFVIFGGPIQQDVTLWRRKEGMLSTPFDTITTDHAQGSSAMTKVAVQDCNDLPAHYTETTQG